MMYFPNFAPCRKMLKLVRVVDVGRGPSVSIETTPTAVLTASVLRDPTNVSRCFTSGKR